MVTIYSRVFQALVKSNKFAAADGRYQVFTWLPQYRSLQTMASTLGPEVPGPKKYFKRHKCVISSCNATKELFPDLGFFMFPKDRDR